MRLNPITWKDTPENQQDEVTALLFRYMICEVMGSGTLATKKIDVQSFNDYIRDLLATILYDFCMQSGKIPLFNSAYSAGWPIIIDIPEMFYAVETYYRYFDFRNPLDQNPASNTIIKMHKPGRYHELYSIEANNTIRHKYDLNDVGNINKELHRVCKDLLGHYIGQLKYDYLVLRGQYSKEASSAISWRLKSHAVDNHYINNMKRGYNMIHTYKPENAPQHVNMVITLEVMLNTTDSFLLEITDCTENWVYARPVYLEKYGENIIKFIRHIKELTNIDSGRLPSYDFNVAVGMIKYNLLKSGLMLDCSLPDGKNYQYILTTYINDKVMKEETGVLELNSENWF